MYIVILSYLASTDVVRSLTLNSKSLKRWGTPSFEASLRKNMPFTLVYESVPEYASCIGCFNFLLRNQCQHCYRVDLGMSRVGRIREEVIQNPRSGRYCIICSPFPSKSILMLLHDIYHNCIHKTPTRLDTLEYFFKKAYGCEVGRLVRPVPSVGIISLKELIMRDPTLSKAINLHSPQPGHPGVYPDNEFSSVCP